LVKRLCHAMGPERIALAGGPGDRSMADAILQRAPAGVLDTVGKLNLKQTAGLIAASEVFVACDTGPMHIAVATGTPLLALFGAADPLRTGPFGREASVLYEPAPCSPCRRRHCNVEGHPCMNNLTVDAVYSRIRRDRDLLGTSRSSVDH
jgi:ADP-heptose:LPS heptosyltransferase